MTYTAKGVGPGGGGDEKLDQLFRIEGFSQNSLRRIHDKTEPGRTGAQAEA